MHPTPPIMPSIPSITDLPTSQEELDRHPRLRGETWADLYLRIGDKPGPILPLRRWNREVRRWREEQTALRHRRHVEQQILNANLRVAASGMQQTHTPGSWSWMRRIGLPVGIADFR